MPLKTLKLFIIHFFIIALFVAGIQTSAFSQENDTIVPIQKNPEKLLRKIDVRKITKNGFNIWKDKFTGHWAGVDFGFNAFLNKDYEGYENEFMDNDVFRSNSTYLNLFQQSIGLQSNRNTVGLVTGLGLHLQSYRLDKNTTFKRLPNDKIEPEILFYNNNQKSKFSIVSAFVPLLCEFQIPINHYDNRLYLSAGTFFKYRISSHTKIKYREEQKIKSKIPDDYSLHNFKYGLMFRSGYRRINIFATYDLTPLFKENCGPKLKPFTFGITLLQF